MNTTNDRVLDVSSLQKRYSSSGTLAIENVTRDLEVYGARSAVEGFACRH